MANDKTKVVDIVPEFGLNGDYKKITEYDFIALNSKIVPVITLCLMEQGSNQLMPNMGLRTVLTTVPFTERGEIDTVISKINDQLSTYVNVSARAYLNEEKSDWLEGDVYISIDIEGVPGTLTLGINKDNIDEMQPFNIQHPSIFVKQ